MRSIIKATTIFLAFLSLTAGTTFSMKKVCFRQVQSLQVCEETVPPPVKGS